MANFQLKPLVQETHRQDDAETVAKKLAEQSISSLERGAVLERPKRKSKPTGGRKKGEPLKIRLPKTLKASVERLSIPRLFSAGREAFERKRSLSQKSFVVSKQSSHTEVAKDEGVNGNNEEYPQVQNDIIPSASIEGENNVDIEVYGVSLKKFFNPRNEAIEVLKKQPESTQMMRWIYPVPNPRVWK